MTLPLGLDHFTFAVPTLIDLHRAAAHFPIALLLTSVFCEVLSLIWKQRGLRETALWAHYLGTIGASVTVALGWFGNPFRYKHGELAQAVTVHQWWGIATLALFGLLACWRLARRNNLDRGERVVYAVLTLVGVVIVSLTGYMGGHLGE